MKTRIHFLIALMSLPLVLVAQNEDDDMYFVPNKKAAKTEKVQNEDKLSRKNYTTMKRSADTNVGEKLNTETDVQYYTGNLRDVDEYNRRYSENSSLKARMVNDTLYIERETEEEANAFASEDRHGYYADDCYYDDDFYYTSRLIRYHGRHFYDPFMWDYCYGWYDPWYDPWYGFYGPYYRYGYYSWYSWGWGWHHRPGWIWGWGCGSPIYHPHYPPHHGHKPGIGQGGGGHRFGTGRHDFVNRGNSNGIHNGNRVLPARTQGVPNATSRGLRGSLTRGNERGTIRETVPSRGRTNPTIVNGRGTSSRNSTVNRSTTPSTNRSSSNVSTSRSSSSSYGSSRSSSSSFGGGFTGGGFSGGGSRGGGGGGGRGGR